MTSLYSDELKAVQIEMMGYNNMFLVHDKEVCALETFSHIGESLEERTWIETSGSKC